MVKNKGLYYQKIEKFKYNNVLQCNKLNKIIISDASTLILLEKIALLGKLAGNFEFIIPQEIYGEAVVKGKKIKSEDSYSIENKINSGVIKIKGVKGVISEERARLRTIPLAPFLPFAN